MFWYNTVTEGFAQMFCGGLNESKDLMSGQIWVL